MGKRTPKSDDMNKDKSCKLERSAASPKRAKSSGKMATEVTETASRKKKLANSKTVLRRSQRIQKEISCTQFKDIEPVTENIDLSGSDEEDHQDEERHHPMEEKKMQEEDSGIWNLEGKIDYLTLLLEAQEKYHEAKSMGADTGFKSQNLCYADFKAQEKRDKYKLMYIDSQKKIESLREENHQLTMKLENALGKLQAYEKGHTVFSETIEKLKDAMLISTITKTTEMMLGISSPGANNCDCTSPTVAEAKSPVAKKMKTSKSSGRK
ncbi:uncharacterized protein LOC122647651 isoform X2 [Telopea speciosissima]|uniref:uncharacterized protein LOC122647651 isoform X2 n=1 Tax=Telopea speciosissima TaxID=54955 RepID=UPI001CC4B5C5|nr:uncharacterized protein LOC122647651 isoform X2 [Telopea speciosissima]